MSVSEYFFWCKYFNKRAFTLDLLDYSQSAIVSSAYNIAAGKAIATPQEFSIFSVKKISLEDVDIEMTDEEIETAAGSSVGVLRIGSD